MRLLNVRRIFGELEESPAPQELAHLMKEVDIENPPRFAILSHGWYKLPVREVLFEDLVPRPGFRMKKNEKGDMDREQRGETSFQRFQLLLLEQEFRSGALKVQSFCLAARKDNYKWPWADQCCINKVNESELNESVTKMYDWYRQAHKCYGFLDDVGQGAGLSLPSRERSK